jgi:hypothetical protein
MQKEITLKNVKVYLGMSQETIAFNTVDQDTINHTLSKEKMEFLLKRQENLLKNLDIIHKDIIKLSENGNG